MRRTLVSLLITLLALAMLVGPAAASAGAAEPDTDDTDATDDNGDDNGDENGDTDDDADDNGDDNGDTDDDADDKADDDGDTDETELTFYAIEDTFTVITRDGEVLTEDDEPEDFAPNAGDRFLSTDLVYADEERDDLVGRNHIDCTVTEAEGEFPEEEPAEGEELPDFRLSFLCSGVLDLFDQGTLSWSGVSTFSSEDLEELTEEELLEEPIIVVAITGGTFDFIGASGEVAIFNEESPDEDEVWSRYEVTLL